METYSSAVGAKFQITLPKKVRQALGIKDPGTLVGFRIEGTRVTIARAKIRLMLGGKTG